MCVFYILCHTTFPRSSSIFLMNATLVSDYTRQVGCFNVVSYFVRGAAKSDLGKLFQVRTVSMHKL